MVRRDAADKTPKITAPRLAPVRPGELRDDPAPEFRAGCRYDGVRYSRASADGLDLGGTDFAECEFTGVSFNETQLRGATFRDCILTEAYAPVLMAARTSLRDVEIGNPRWGSAELYESGWQSVRIDGGKLDYVNLRGSKLTDVQISDCIINELDLGLLHRHAGRLEELHDRHAGFHRSQAQGLRSPGQRLPHCQRLGQPVRPRHRRLPAHPARSVAGGPSGRRRRVIPRHPVDPLAPPCNLYRTNGR